MAQAALLGFHPTNVFADPWVVGKTHCFHFWQMAEKVFFFFADEFGELDWRTHPIVELW